MFSYNVTSRTSRIDVMDGEYLIARLRSTDDVPATVTVEWDDMSQPFASLEEAMVFVASELID